MLSAARTQSVIEILDNLITQWGEGRSLPADQALGHYVRSRRFIGSKDRRAMAEIFYDAMRVQGLVRWWLEELKQPLTGRNWLLWLLNSQGKLSEQAADFGATAYSPPVLSDEETQWLSALENSDKTPSAAAQANIPQWLYDRLQARWGDATVVELAALQQPAPLVLRVNTLKTNREKALKELRDAGLDVEETEYSPIGIRVLSGRVNLSQLPAYTEGRIESQDESSQLACQSLAVEPGMNIIDLCSGAGGKALALAAQIKDKGEILAIDSDERRMRDLAPRVERAGLDSVSYYVPEKADAAFPKELHGTADAVLLDAPCTGMGTLRRHPDLPWRTTPEQVEILQRTQSSLLRRAISLLKPGGMLLYATCSLLEEENEAVVNQFLDGKLMLKLADAPQVWNKLLPTEEDPRSVGLTLTPHRHQTDGFFMALLQKPHTA